jgi:hypothetical protein
MAQQPMYQKIAEDLRRRIQLGANPVLTSDSPEPVEPTSPHAGSQQPMTLKPGNQLPAGLKPGSQMRTPPHGTPSGTR